MLFHNLLTSTFLITGSLATLHGSVYFPSRAKRQNPQDMVSVQPIKVGDMDGNLKFSPDSVQAQPGSMLQFQFYPGVSKP